ncbi:hypothetical protein [Nonomuraea sp. NPDC050310]|uniref:hypothetical protein n=1 Tax=unclassified Nonomuraea TaxID=2593643 RepID=UPI0033FFD520
MRGLFILAAVVLVSGCAPDASAPIGTAERFYRALTSGQPDAACLLLAPRTAAKLPDEGESCGQALAKLGLEGGQVERAAVWGEEAQVSLAEDTLFLHRYADGWRIKAAGCEPRPELPFDCEVED